MSTDWTEQLAGAIEDAVGTIRDRTVVPVERIVRIVVAGLLVAFFATVALLLAALGAFRGLSILFGDEVWAVHLALGGIFVAAGLFCWSRR
jgi:hypothetical protein